MEETVESDAIKLLESLQDSIAKTQCFRSKWSVIKAKLNTLQTHLSRLSDTNPLSVDLLSSLSSTLSAALFLSALCHHPTPPHGKLKTQNDIDCISAQLDSLTNDTKVLTKTHAVKLNCKESTQRVELRNLITRLQIGSTKSKNSVLDLLLGLLSEDDKNVTIAVGQELVPVLVRLLDSNSSLEIREKIIACIARVSAIDSIKHALVTEGLGLLANLLRVLECGSVFAKEKSCLALQALSQTKENARLIGCRGGISSLLEICQAGTPTSQAVAAGVLRNLAVHEENKENFMEENAVMILLSLANTGTSFAQENALGCLSELMLHDDDNSIKLMVARNGGIDTLKNYWDSAASMESFQVAVSMLCVLVSCPLIVNAIVETGFLNRVIGVLSSGVVGLRIVAAKAVYDLGYNNKTRKELGEMGCIPLLVGMLEGKAVEEKDAAAKALSALLVYTGNRRIFRKEERGIIAVVQLLDPLTKELDKKYPVLILACLAHSRKFRKQLMGAGACPHLQKLADMDVDGTKQVLDGLRRGKLWGVFTRH